MTENTGVSGKKYTVTVDFGCEKEPVHAVNGVCNGPKFCFSDGKANFDVTEDYRALRIPSVRIHDPEYPYGHDTFVDLHCVFPDFSKNPEDPASYHFAETDLYIQAIRDAGCEVVYRLGESIDHTGDFLYTRMPEDPEKWADICVGVIRHFNEGFADGYHYNIRYWEIWNEPVDVPDMWKGSESDFLKLYGITAKKLKTRFPELKIGGSALSSVESEFAEHYVSYSRENGLPLDFFSYHRYVQDPRELRSWTESARKLLARYGYEEAELVLDEWNHVENWDYPSIVRDYIDVRSKQCGAAFVLACMIVMQQAGVDIAHYYAVDMLDVWGALYVQPGFDDAFLRVFAGEKLPPAKFLKAGVKLLSHINITKYPELCRLIKKFPDAKTDAAAQRLASRLNLLFGPKLLKLPVYYAFEAFAPVTAAGMEVLCETEGADLYALAAKGNGTETLVIVNNSAEAAEDIAVTLRGTACRKVRLTVYTEQEKTGHTEDMTLTDGTLRLRLERYAYASAVFEN